MHCRLLLSFTFASLRGTAFTRNNKKNIVAFSIITKNSSSTASSRGTRMMVGDSASGKCSSAPPSSSSSFTPPPRILRSSARRMALSSSSSHSNNDKNNTNEDDIITSSRPRRHTTSRDCTSSSTTRTTIQRTSNTNNNTKEGKGQQQRKNNEEVDHRQPARPLGNNKRKRKSADGSVITSPATSTDTTTTTTTITSDTSSKKKKKKLVAKNDTTTVDAGSSNLPSSSYSSASLDPNNMLLDLGNLIKGRLIQRPSASIRSPYVADVLLLENDNDHDDIRNDNSTATGTTTAESNNKIVQAHCPSLDVGGLCVPGTLVYLKERNQSLSSSSSSSSGGGGKTSHSLQLILAPAPHCAVVAQDDVENTGVLVGVHPQLGEQLAQSALTKGLLQDVIGYGSATLAATPNGKEDTTPLEQLSSSPLPSPLQEKGKVVLYRQCTRGDSRVDFELVEYSTTPTTSTTPANDKKPNIITTPLLRRCLIEVKNVVCTDIKADLVVPTQDNNQKTKGNTSNSGNTSKSKNKNHCIIPSYTEPYSRSALFPWGRLGQTFEGTKVVSERAIKHLRNLANESNHHLHHGIVLFVINRSDCESMRACHEACPMFAQELKIAAEKGCTVTSFRVHWTMDGKAYFDGIIPVKL